MKINHKNRIYNTDVAVDYRTLCSIASRTTDSRVINSIRSQIEDAKVVTKRDINIYRTIRGWNRIRAHDFSYSAFKPILDGNESPIYTFDGKGFVKLPHAATVEEITYKLIDKLLYEAQRAGRGWNRAPCPYLRKLIAKLQPEYANHNKGDYVELMAAVEQTTGDYYGGYLSDDSDSDEEDRHQRESTVKKSALSLYAQEMHRRASLKRYERKVSKTLTGTLTTPPKKELSRARIHRDGDMRQARRDLKRLNEAIRAGEVNSVIGSLQTQFVVAQYRGICYSTLHWNMPGRRIHRRLNEVGNPQFSFSVLREAGFKTFSDYMYARQKDKRIDLRLTIIAKRLREKLLKLRDTSAVTYKGYAFKSQAHLLQYLYTTNYTGFHRFVKAHYKGSLRQYLMNEFNPFISTGGTPYHALKYAYGNKFYKGHKHERLRPRWRKNGRAERPYSGKAYVSLHPVSDCIDRDGPLHVPTLFRSGDIVVDNETVPEDESCFPAFLPSKRVVMQHIAKFPSFKDGGYKAIYRHKYGLTRAAFEAYRDGFRRYPPHSAERQFLKLNLGEHLCAYHEVRLIEETRRLAKAQGVVLIYRNHDGTFTFEPRPITPKNTKGAWRGLHRLRDARRRLATTLCDRPNEVESVTYQESRDALSEKTRLKQIDKKLLPLFGVEIEKKRALLREIRESGNAMSQQTIDVDRGNCTSATRLVN